jgi:hypothetical protein
MLFVLTAALLIGTPRAVHAQNSFLRDNIIKIIRKTGVHVNASYRIPTDDDVREGRTYGLSVGLSPGETNGWRYPVGLTFFSERLHGPTGREFARLRARAILGGFGYGWHFGKLSTGISLQAGYADYSLRGQGDVFTALEVAAGPVTLDVRNTWLLRPQLKAEYFLTRKITVRVSGDYTRTRPDIIVTTSAGQFANQWDASSYHANIGIGIYPLRK